MVAAPWDLSWFLSVFLDPFYLRILYLTLILFVAGWVLWFMYINLSHRDLFKLQHPRDVKKTPSFWDRLFYVLKYVFLFPVFTFLWFVLFVFCLRLLSAKQDLQEIMLLGIVLISAVRIAAYVSGRMAEDLAKLLPLTLLAGIILNPSFITLNANLLDLVAFTGKLAEFAKYLLFIIALEFVLRIGHALHRRIRKGKGAPTS